MNIIVASSRGFGLEKYLPANTSIHAKSGGTLKELRKKAKELIPPPYGLSRRPHVYFLGGVPNISRLIKEPGNHYKECIYDENPSETSDHFYNELLKTQNSMLKRGALPIFCTVPKFNLTLYNNDLLTRNRTSALHYTSQYEDMQKNLNTAIDSINSHIYQTNLKTKVSTPFLHCSVMERRGRKNKRYYIYKWELYTDGLHATDDLQKIWMKAIEKAIKLNENLEDSDDEEKSPKRSWRFSSKRPRVEGI